MIKKNKVSLWLGNFTTSNEFFEYLDIKYDEDGNFIKSKFQKDFSIIRYDLDAFEKRWVLEEYNDLENLLAGFSYDYDIIPKFEKIISNRKLISYNSILLLYNFEYEKTYINKKMDYIGCVDVNMD